MLTSGLLTGTRGLNGRRVITMPRLLRAPPKDRTVVDRQGKLLPLKKLRPKDKPERIDMATLIARGGGL